MKGPFVLQFSDVNDPKSTVNWSLKFDKTAQLAAVETKPQKMNTPVRTQQTLTDLVAGNGREIAAYSPNCIRWIE